MDLSELLNGPIGQTVINNVANQLGMDERQAASAVSVALPAILGGMQRNVQSQQGAQNLNNALNDARHDGSLLENLGSLLGGNSQAISQDGGKILGHIFGNNKSALEQGISQKTGISLQKIGPLLALLAPIVMAYLGKEKRQTNTNAGGLGDLLGGLLGGGQPQKQRGGGLMGMIGGLLDKNKDGNVLDDILGMIK
ncbi:MAG: DUF937 domain-containing protein [Bacteroidia bacterium]|nr:DUF937 domain-containing protein [Bacteroidia bacterium]